MIEGHLILSLKLQETCYQYWPESGLIQFREYTVDLMEEKVMEGFTKRTISVYNEKVTLFCISVHMTCSLQTASAHQVFQLHMTNWNPDGSIPELAPLVSVINETSAIQRRTGNKSVLVHCRSDNVHNVALVRPHSMSIVKVFISLKEFLPIVLLWDHAIQKPLCVLICGSQPLSLSFP